MPYQIQQLGNIVPYAAAPRRGSRLGDYSASPAGGSPRIEAARVAENDKTAKALGLIVPQTLQVVADELIE